MQTQATSVYNATPDEAVEAIDPYQHDDAEAKSAKSATHSAKAGLKVSELLKKQYEEAPRTHEPRILPHSPATIVADVGSTLGSPVQTPEAARPTSGILVQVETAQRRSSIRSSLPYHAPSNASVPFLAQHHMRTASAQSAQPAPSGFGKLRLGYASKSSEKHTRSVSMPGLATTHHHQPQQRSSVIFRHDLLTEIIAGDFGRSFEGTGIGPPATVHQSTSAPAIKPRIAPDAKVVAPWSEPKEPEDPQPAPLRPQRRRTLSVGSISDLVKKHATSLKLRRSSSNDLLSSLAKEDASLTNTDPAPTAATYITPDIIPTSGENEVADQGAIPRSRVIASTSHGALRNQPALRLDTHITKPQHSAHAKSGDSGYSGTTISAKPMAIAAVRSGKSPPSSGFRIRGRQLSLSSIPALWSSKTNDSAVSKAQATRRHSPSLSIFDPVQLHHDQYRSTTPEATFKALPSKPSSPRPMNRALSGSLNRSPAPHPMTPGSNFRYEPASPFPLSQSACSSVPSTPLSSIPNTARSESVVRFAQDPRFPPGFRLSTAPTTPIQRNPSFSQRSVYPPVHESPIPRYFSKRSVSVRLPPKVPASGEINGSGQPWTRSVHRSASLDALHVATANQILLTTPPKQGGKHTDKPRSEHVTDINEMSHTSVPPSNARDRVTHQDDTYYEQHRLKEMARDQVKRDADYRAQLVTRFRPSTPTPTF